MSKTSLMTIRIDPDVKKRFEELYASFGLKVSDAINMFIHQSLIAGGLPFDLRYPTFGGEMSVENGAVNEVISDFSLDRKSVV